MSSIYCYVLNLPIENKPSLDDSYNQYISWNLKLPKNVCYSKTALLIEPESFYFTLSGNRGVGVRGGSDWDGQ